jgi:hypothetical protein
MLDSNLQPYWLYKSNNFGIFISQNTIWKQNSQLHKATNIVIFSSQDPNITTLYAGWKNILQIPVL